MHSTHHDFLEDLSFLPSPATFWDPTPSAPFPSFTRTLAVTTTFGHLHPDTASRVLAHLGTTYESDDPRRARLVAFLESEQDPTKTTHYDAFLMKRIVEFFKRQRRSDEYFRSTGREGRGRKEVDG